MMRERLERSAGGGLAHAPALDGLRGLCLLAVFLFHAPFAWMSGGFLGVSTFFTLSGYLITALLLGEYGRTERISIAGFWDRRLRRLLPALFLTVALVVGSSPFWLAPSARERLLPDALASLLFVVNFRFMSPEFAYSQVFAAPSPFQHCWSLAIEGQFYLVFPLLVALVLRVGGSRGLGVLVVASLIASLGVLSPSRGIASAAYRLYYGTDARAAELLVGSGLALLAPALRGRARRLLGAPALLGIVVAWATLRVDAPVLYRGGLLVYAVLSACVVSAATEEGGIVRALLSPAWLRWIGRTSYGGYLYHWPILLLLDPTRTGLAPLPSFALRLTATLALAGLSYRWIEEPIRRGRALGGRRLYLAAGAASAALIALGVARSPWGVRVAAARTLRSASSWLGQARAAPAFRFAFFGDSTALSLASGLGGWLDLEGGGGKVPGSTHLGCGLLAVGRFAYQGGWIDSKHCADMPRRWTETARNWRADLAVVLIGPWEVRTRRLRPTGRARGLGDPYLDAELRAEIEKAIAGFEANGTAVVWLTSPRVAVRRDEVQPAERAASDPKRMARLNEIIAEVAARHPETVRIVDLGGYLQRWPGGELDPALRPDGVHLSSEGALEISWRWLGAEVLRGYRELRPAAPKPSLVNLNARPGLH